MRYLKIRCLDDVPLSPNLKETYHWNKFLTDTAVRDDLQENSLDSHFVVPVAAFFEPVFPGLTQLLKKGNTLEIEVHDYKRYSNKKSIWFADVVKVAGYRLLLRYSGSVDIREDFWVNIGSKDIGHFGLECNEEVNLWPPVYFFKSINDPLNIIFPHNHIEIAREYQQNRPMFSQEFEHARSTIFFGKFVKDQCVELLDTNDSTRIRPARIIGFHGRRIFLQIDPKDCPREDKKIIDRQYGDDKFWIDQDSFLLFFTGWAAYNGYEYLATDEYRRHAEEIAEALHMGTLPPWWPMDTRPDLIRSDFLNYEEETYWEVGMKFELLDPLSGKFQKLHIATVKKLLKNGYMIVGMDDGEEHDSFPIHCTSKFMFPMGYAERHKIKLELPKGVENFTWATYLESQNAVAARAELFETVERPGTTLMFSVGAKLEATDFCGNFAIYPATVAKKHGRLIRIHYDGWEATDDNLVDVESHDIFPLGYAELNGYVLEDPHSIKILGPKKKRRSNRRSK